MRYAIITSGKVANVILWDGVAPWEYSEEAVVCPDDAGIGWNYDGEFSEPEAP